MRRLLLFFAAILISNIALAQIDAPVKWAYAAKKINNNEAIVFLKATIGPGWHIYAQGQKDVQALATVFTFNNSTGFMLKGKTSEPQGITKFEKAIKANITYFEKQVTFQQKVALQSNKTTIKGKLEYVACNGLKCIPREELAFSIPVM